MTKPTPKQTTAIQEERRDSSPPVPSVEDVHADRSVSLAEGQTDTWGARITLLIWVAGFCVLALQILADLLGRLFGN